MLKKETMSLIKPLNKYSSTDVVAISFSTVLEFITKVLFYKKEQSSNAKRSDVLNNQ